MRRVLVALTIVGTLVLTITAAPPAGANAPKSIIGSGKTRVIQNYMGTGTPRILTMATAKNGGLITVVGGNSRPVNCVHSFTKSGITMAVVTTKAIGGRWFLMALSEGGFGHAPYAVVYDGAFFESSGFCNSGWSEGSFPLDIQPPEFRVPAKQFRIVGG